MEYYRAASSKDVSGWRGPGTVVDTTSIHEGVVHVKFQGKIIAVKLGELRRALVYGVFFRNEPTQPWRHLVVTAEGPFR